MGLYCVGTDCPRWCTADIPADDGLTIHMSACRVVNATADPNAAGLFHVTAERRDGAPGGVRVEGGGELMTAAEALDLASALRAAAVLLMAGMERAG